MGDSLSYIDNLLPLLMIFLLTWVKPLVVVCVAT